MVIGNKIVVINKFKSNVIINKFQGDENMYQKEDQKEDIEEIKKILGENLVT